MLSIEPLKTLKNNISDNIILQESILVILHMGR